MKNFSKKNYSKKNDDKDKRRSKSTDSYKSSNVFKGNENNRNKRNKNNNRKDENNYRNEYKDLNKSEDYRNNHFRQVNPKNKYNNERSKEGIYRNNPNRESSSENNFKNDQYIINNRNFDDWIWGKHSVFSCLISERPINRIWCTSDVFSSEKFYLLLKDLKSKGILIEEVSWSRLSQITSGAVHQGIALQLASSKTISLGNLIDLAKSKSSTPILVALDGITDPHNLGAIIRSSEAFDCKGIIIPQRRSAGLTGTVAKVAAGALEHIPVSRVVNLNRALDELKKKGFLVIGLSGDGQLPISQFNEKSPLVLIVGAENKGISLLTQKNCDLLLKIPLKGKTSSLNASVAAAISLYYLSNQ